MSKKNKTRDAVKSDLVVEIDQSLSWVFIILIGILPLIMGAKVIDFTSPRIIATVLDTGTKIEVFSYYKWIFLVCAAIVVIAMLLFKILAYHYELRKSYINIPVLLLTLFFVLSVLTTQYKGIALTGLYNEYGGTLTYLCYFALLLVAANTSVSERFSRCIIYALGIFTFISLIIIICHFYGHDLIRLGFVKSLFIPAQYSGSSHVTGELWSTLANPNYVSGLAAALFAFFLAFTLLETRIKKRSIYLICSVSSFIIMLATLSTSGFVSLLIVSPVIVTVAFLGQDRKQTIITAGATIVLCLAALLVMNAHNPGVSDNTFGFVKDIFRNGNGTSQSTPDVPGGIKTPEPNYFQLPAPGVSLGNGRIYIWNETLKLIKQRPLLGYGQDTMAYYFPQNDINKIAEMGSYEVLISKPHNMYLAIAYGSGIPALLCLVILFSLHLFYTGRRLLKAERNESVIFSAALFLFFCTFSVQWLFNDSVLGSSAIFWTLMGVGVSLNTSGINRCRV